MALMDRRLKDPFAVKFKNDDAKRDFVEWLCDCIQQEEAARSAFIEPYGNLDYSHWLYEQGKTPAKALPFPGAADLNSTIVTEKVDGMRARIIRTIFTNPVWTVQGWGEDAKKAPFSEEFHQWMLERERLQQYLSKVIHNSLVEQNGILEVVERSDVRLVQQLQRFAAQLAEDGSPLIGDDGRTPLIQKDDRGMPIVAQDEAQPFIEAQTATYKTTRKGPGYRVISQRNFLFLPGHAVDKADLYGYAKRCWVRMASLAERATLGVYDKAAVDALHTLGDPQQLQPGLERAGQSLAEQRDHNAEKELWEVQVLYDCDGDGIEEWYFCTVSVIDRVLLRISRETVVGDGIALPRYLDFTPFPRSDSVYGYSFVGDKLATTAEEDTALRNSIADRSTMATHPPLKVMQGAAWNPRNTPWGSGQIIRVRAMNEIEPMVIPDVPQSAFVQRQLVRQSADGLAGMNDTAIGVQTEERRTATENSLVAQASAVRTDEAVKNIQEALEVLWLVRNEIWMRTLREQPDGMEMPSNVVKAIETRGLEIQNGKFTAGMLGGNLRGMPRGSVETADPTRMLQAFNGGIQALAGMARFNPVFAMILQDPEVAQSLLEQWARCYSVQDRFAFMQAAQRARQEMQARAEMQQRQQAMLSQLPPELQAALQAGGGQPGQPALPPGPEGGQP